MKYAPHYGVAAANWSANNRADLVNKGTKVIIKDTASHVRSMPQAQQLETSVSVVKDEAAAWDIRAKPLPGT